jgi:hypothetical protein
VLTTSTNCSSCCQLLFTAFATRGLHKSNFSSTFHFRQTAVIGITRQCTFPHFPLHVNPTKTFPLGRQYAPVLYTSACGMLCSPNFSKTPQICARVYNDSYIVRRIRENTQSYYYLRHVCLSPVHPSAWNNSVRPGRILTKLDVFRNSAEKIQDSLKYDQNDGHFTRRPVCVCDNISLDTS